MLRRTGFKASGLTAADVQERHGQHGFNELVEKKRKSKLQMFVSQFADFMIIVLLIAAVVSAALGHAVDAAAIAAILVINAAIGFVQEYKAEKAIAALKKMLSPQARVFRDDTEQLVQARELVPGDLVALSEGDHVPADVRVIDSFNLEAEEAMLTGESNPVKKDHTASVAGNAVVAERANMLFMGTYLVRGKAKAVVVETGMHTQLGGIAKMVSEFEEEQTPLQKQLETMGKQLAAIALGVSLVIFVTGLLRASSAAEVENLFLIAVSLAVAAIPEGLPVVVTITLAIAVQRMATRHAIMRKLPAVETLGSTTIICSDKTGTLTKNEMTVRQVVTASATYEVGGSGYALEGGFTCNGEPARPAKAEEARLLLEAGVLCNSSIIEAANSHAAAIGDPTEASLLVLAAKAGVDYKKARQENRLEFEIPFDSTRKMMTTVHSSSAGRTAYSKGAPEVVIQKCSHYMEDGHVKRLDESKKEFFKRKIEEMASQSLRVLALAFKKNASAGDNEENLTLLGLVGMNDPPRPEARQAIALCKTAGIRVMMITGDNPLTAKAVARELGLISENDGRVINGHELNEMTDYQLREAVKTTSVYARVSPEHKLKLVKALQEQGHVVAMTGDGVNDAPAIKKADIGIAMGKTGTDVTKEASEMVVTDDNFASIVAAVEEGRIVYDNIINTAKYLVSIGVGEIFLIAGAVLVGLHSPLTAIQILWMNLITGSFPALALGMESKSLDVMKRLPRKKTEKILSKPRLVSIIAVGLFMAVTTIIPYYYLLATETPIIAQTVAFNIIIGQQLLYALASRSAKHSIFKLGVFSNKPLVAAVAFGFALQIAIVQTPFLQPLFGTVPLTASHWAMVFIASTAILLASEVSKLFNKENDDSPKN